MLCYQTLSDKPIATYIPISERTKKGVLDDAYHKIFLGPGEGGAGREEGRAAERGESLLINCVDMNV